MSTISFMKRADNFVQTSCTNLHKLHKHTHTCTTLCYVYARDDQCLHWWHEIVWIVVVLHIWMPFKDIIIIYDVALDGALYKSGRSNHRQTHTDTHKHPTTHASHTSPRRSLHRKILRAHSRKLHLRAISLGNKTTPIPVGCIYMMCFIWYTKRVHELDKHDVHYWNDRCVCM